MYAYPVHSSVPAPRTAARASWKSAVSGCLARGLKAHHCDRHGGTCPERRAVLVGGVTLAVLAVNLPLYLAALLLWGLRELKGHHRVMAPFGSMSASIRRLAAPASFSPAHTPQACLSVCLHTKFGSGLPQAAPAGETYPYIKSERLFSTA